jgi:FlaG/FlaF family flagellin (archaellin)
MKSPVGLVLVLLIFLSGCSSSHEFATRAPESTAESAKTADVPERAGAAARTATSTSSEMIVSQNANYQQVSLSQVDVSASAAEAADRKIIRNGNLTIEVNSTSEAQQKVTSIAEANGGFVVTSEAKQRESAEPERRTLDIKLVVRVPAERFGAALEAIHGLANTLKEENVTGQDVTEEFIDLEARIRTQKALEVQFLEIMKQARKVEDALEVQRQIADVRTDIEKLEGRKRFLENRSSLSTITVNIQAPKMIAVNTTGFGRSLRDAVSEGVDVGSAILLGLVRFVIVMIPVSIFLLLPLGLLFRYFVRRAQRMRLAASLMDPAPAAGD